MHMEKWGFLRETTEKARKCGLETNTSLHRTGLDEYLKAIFPNTTDWVHDKCIKDSSLKTRPDYRSDELGLIVEFDGIPHYQKPDVILRDLKTTADYENLWYKVVRIPYFIQLTNSAIKELFGVDVQEPMFNPKYPSLDDSSGSPAYLCPAGLERMAKDFHRFPEQYRVNLNALKSFNNDFLTGASLLEAVYNKLN